MSMKTWSDNTSGWPETGPVTLYHSVRMQAVAAWIRTGVILPSSESIFSFPCRFQWIFFLFENEWTNSNVPCVQNKDRILSGHPNGVAAGLGVLHLVVPPHVPVVVPGDLWRISVRITVCRAVFMACWKKWYFTKCQETQKVWNCSDGEFRGLLLVTSFLQE